MSQRSKVVLRVIGWSSAISLFLLIQLIFLTRKTWLPGFVIGNKPILLKLSSQSVKLCGPWYLRETDDGMMALELFEVVGRKVHAATLVIARNSGHDKSKNQSYIQSPPEMEVSNTGKGCRYEGASNITLAKLIGTAKWGKNPTTSDRCLRIDVTSEGFVMVFVASRSEGKRYLEDSVAFWLPDLTFSHGEKLLRTRFSGPSEIGATR